MKPIRLILTLLTVVVAPAFAQETEKTGKPVTDPKSETRQDGLVKIAGPARNLNFVIRLDGKALEQDIESALRLALRSVDHSVEAIQIHLQPIAINLQALNQLNNTIEINIPHIDVDIEPMEIEMDDFDFDFDFDHDFDLDIDVDDEDSFMLMKEKQKVREEKDKEAKVKMKEKEEKEKFKEEQNKSKGLKKIN